MSRSTRSHSSRVMSAHAQPPNARDQFSLLVRRDLSHNLSQTSKRYIGLLRQVNAVERPFNEMTKNIISNLKTIAQDADKRMLLCNEGMQQMSRSSEQSLKKLESGKDRDEMSDVEDESAGYPRGKYKRRRQDVPLPQPRRSISRPESKRFSVPLPLRERSSASPAPWPVVHHKQRQSTHVPPPKFFGNNPLAYPDATEYEIRRVPEEVSVEEKKKSYNVAEFPKSDLSEYLPAPLPNKDLSRPRPQNQAGFKVLLGHIDPYVRKIDDSNLAFLTDKGDRLTPFLLPSRGKKKYRGLIHREHQLRTGSYSQRQQFSPISDDERQTASDDDDYDSEIEYDKDQLDRLAEVPILLDRLHSVLGRTALAHQIELENSTGNASDDATHPSIRARRTRSYSRAVSGSSGYVQLNERLQAELRDSGAAPPSSQTGHRQDESGSGEAEDELATRILHLQHHLRRQIVINDARKKRVYDIARDYLAYQEYMAIKNDLDAQIEHAYQRRLRTTEGRGAKRVISYSESSNNHNNINNSNDQSAIEASKKAAIGESIRMLLDRRQRWIRCIGPLFKNCSFTIMPQKGESIFDPTVMKGYLKKDLQQKSDDKD